MTGSVDTLHGGSPTAPEPSASKTRPGVPGWPADEGAPLVPVMLPEPPAAVTSPEVRADDPWAEAGRKLFRFHLGKVLARVPGVLAAEDPEEVHAMRVSARRMRATWRVFGDGFERDARRRYQAELRTIGACLGAVRDLDVLVEIASSHGQRRGARQRAGLARLVTAWDAERKVRHVELVELLESDGFATFVDDYDALVRTPGLASVPVSDHAPALVRNRMPARAWDAYQDVWAFDAHLAGADLGTLHELRIAAKWLRYTLEFVREPLDPDATALIRPVVALQDHLGAIHDHDVAAEAARLFLTRTPPDRDAAKAIARFLEALDEGVARGRRTIDRTWRPVAAPDYRRALGRALARL